MKTFLSNMKTTRQPHKRSARNVQLYWVRTGRSGLYCKPCSWRGGAPSSKILKH